MCPAPTTSAGSTVVDTFLSIVEKQVVNPLIILITIIAFAYFVWGVVGYIRNAANDEKRAESQRGMIWGVVGLVIIFGAIAIVNIINNVTGIFCM